MDEWTLNDLLECSVCLERLDTSSKVLPCQHTFCKKCLEEILMTHKELRCPECRVLVDIKIDELPPNVLLMRILEGMRNAAPKKRGVPPNRMPSANIPTSGPHVLTTPQQQQLPPQQTPLSYPLHPSPKQVQPPQPCARAIYDYIAKEPGDLSFKKGDIILLRKKIDTHWYQGEIGGHFGAFPLTYVQIITPLPNQIPQCKALYDFRMTNDDDEGCLTFNKGEIITVLRRIDENWAEGRLGERIGIFPLAFVELNVVARALMKLSTNSQPGPSRVAPPTPTSEDTTPLIPTDHNVTAGPQGSAGSGTNTVTVSSQPPSQHSVQHVTSGGSDSSSSGSTAASSSTTPNTSSSNTSSSSSTAPSSPTSPPPRAVPIPNASPTHIPTQRDKRHSLAAFHTPHTSQPSHRLSAEILSPSEPASNVSENHTSDQSQEIGSGAIRLSRSCGNATVQSSLLVQRQGSKRHKRNSSNDLSGLNPPPPPPQGSLVADASAHLPTAYVALYPYKPQKTDELELKKGGIYVVTERCQDGWFKGTSNRTQKCGVFPGNYVAPANSRGPISVQQLRGISRGISPTGSCSPGGPPSPRGSGGTTPPLEPPRVAGNFTRGKPPGGCTALLPYSPRMHNGVSGASTQLTAPPELPPRSTSPNHSLASVPSTWHNQNSIPVTSGPSSIISTPAPTSLPTVGPAVSTEGTGPNVSVGTMSTPLSRSLSAVLASGLASVVNTSNSGVGTLLTVATATAPSGSAAATPAAGSSATVTMTTKNKEKKDKSVSLMRRLTSMKKSKSPPPATYSMDNPVFEDGTVAASPAHPTHPSYPVHVRSGSCPSQLLQALPLDASSAHHRLFGSGSQRLKHSDRPNVVTANLAHFGRSGDPGPAFNVSAYHRKSNSLDANSGETARKASKPLVPPVRERYRCIVPYPPMSEHELELRVGDVIYVHKKRDDGWYKGTQQRTGRTGLFPSSFVENY